MLAGCDDFDCLLSTFTLTSIISVSSKVVKCSNRSEVSRGEGEEILKEWVM